MFEDYANEFVGATTEVSWTKSAVELHRKQLSLPSEFLQYLQELWHSLHVREAPVTK
jgi:hypothetical protein